MNSASAASGGVHRKKRFNYRSISKLKDFILVVPALVLLAAFHFYPIVYSFFLSFTDWNFVRPVKHFIGFDNYAWMFSDNQFFNVLKVTLLYTVLDVVLSLSVGLLLALLMNSTKKIYAVLRFFVFMPYYIALVVAALVFIWILNFRYGLLNSILHDFGIDPVNWLNTPSTALWSLLFVALWKSSGFHMIIFIGGLRGIPIDYYESSSLDGANRWHQFRHITLPLLSPITLFLFITSFIGAMQVFQSVDLMTNGGPLDSTRVMVFYIYQIAFGDFQIGRSSALVSVFFLIILAISFVQYYISSKKVHYEG